MNLRLSRRLFEAQPAMKSTRVVVAAAQMKFRTAIADNVSVIAED